MTDRQRRWRAKPETRRYRSRYNAEHARWPDVAARIRARRLIYQRQWRARPENAERLALYAERAKEYRRRPEVRERQNALRRERRRRAVTFTPLKGAPK